MSDKTKKPAVSETEVVASPVVVVDPKAEAAPVAELTIIEKMIKEINETTDKIIIDGKKYTTVAKRNEILRKHLGLKVSVTTEHLNIDNDKVIFKCSISTWKKGAWHVIATGHAEESRSANEINKKAAVENAETSALGRALSNLGLSGGEFASINELSLKTGLVAKADDTLMAHVKELIKESGINQTALLGSLNLKSLDMMKEEDALKAIKKCLVSIQNKKKPKGGKSGSSESGKNDGQEEVINL